MTQHNNQNSNREAHDDLISAIQQSYSAVTYPQNPRSSKDFVVVKPISKNRAGFRVSFALAASFVVIATVVFSSLPGSETAWAATPKTVSSEESERFREVCEAATHSENDEEALAPINLTPPTLVDYRGDMALSIFTQEGQNAICVTRVEGDKLSAGSLTVMSGGQESMPGVVAESSVERVNGDSISYVSGFAPKGTTRVTFSLTDGTEVTASLKDGFYVAWYPSDKRIDPQSVSFQ